MPHDQFSAGFRDKFRTLLMNYLYTERDRIMRSGIDQIAVKQKRLLGGNLLGFHYLNETYHHSRELQKWSSVYHLAPALQEEMNALLVQADIVPNESLRVKNFLTVILTLVKNPADLKALLPEQLLPVLNQTFAHMMDKFEQTINSEKLLEFKSNKQEDYELVNKRIVLNMVLK
ncbi:MAG: hypothetical protein ACRBB6_04450 [Neptuniibacter sp.]